MWVSHTVRSDYNGGSQRRFALLTLLDTSLSLLLEPRGFCMYTSADATESSAAAIIHRIGAVIWMSICLRKSQVEFWKMS